MGRKRAQEQYTVEVLREQGGPVDLGPLADALLLLLGGPELDAALDLAHDLNAADYQQEAHRQALEATADDLRVQVAQIEKRLRRAV